jgi:hypothetical protein
MNIGEVTNFSFFFIYEFLNKKKNEYLRTIPAPFQNKIYLTSLVDSYNN